MPSGTGHDLFEKEFPKRFFDVGIAEQHAVTFAAGLATEGFKPFRHDLFDLPAARLRSIVHDVAIQRLPCASRSTAPVWSAPTARPMPAPLTLPISAACPAFVLMAAADEAELVHMVATQVAIDDRPSALRYPRGEGLGVGDAERSGRSRSAKAACCARATR